MSGTTYHCHMGESGRDIELEERLPNLVVQLKRGLSF